MAETGSETRARLLEAELQRFVGIVMDEMKPQQILLYGSFASGHVTEWSDLDLVVVAESDMRFFDRIGKLIAQVRPRVGMDVVVYTPQEWREVRERPFVRQEILGNGRVIYESSGPVA